MVLLESLVYYKGIFYIYIVRLSDDGFQRVYKQTVGIDFIQKNIDLKGSLYSLQIWDIGGQVLFFVFNYV